MKPILLESLLPKLRRQMEADPKTISHIDLVHEVKEFIERMSESDAWEVASYKFEYVETNAEKFIEMIMYLHCKNNSVSFWHDFNMKDPKAVSCNYERFGSFTIYGALAKCILFHEFWEELAMIEMKYCRTHHDHFGIVLASV